MAVALAGPNAVETSELSATRSVTWAGGLVLFVGLAVLALRLTKELKKQ